MPGIVGFRIDEVIAIDVHVSVASAAFKRLVSYTSVAAGAVDNLVSLLLQTLWSVFARLSVECLLRVATVSIACFQAAALIPLICGRQTLCLPTFAFGIYVPALSKIWQLGWFYQGT